MIKAVTVFAGSRDHYQLPIALAEANLLEALVTDLYFPNDRKWFNATVGQIIPDHILSKRFRSELHSQYVHLPTLALAVSATTRVLPQVNANWFKDQVLGASARKRAINTGSALLAYSYYAYQAFKPGADQSPYRFLFQVHPHPLTVRRVLSEELGITPTARDSLIQEAELRIPDHQLERLSQEPTLANGWVAASSFTKQSLVENGIPADQIHVVPYGVDTSAFAQRTEQLHSDQPFTVIFVGQMIQRKGLSYLLDAIRLMKSRHIQLILCGRGYIDQSLFENYQDLNIEVHVNLPFSGLLEQLYRSHIFVLPSLVEGFGHVIVEAMATGLPVIATPHTGGVDIITDGKEGYIVPIRSAEAIAEKLSWAIDNPSRLREMGNAAAQQARKFTWERFRQAIVHAYLQMIEQVDK